jgi:hypothetical protein
MDVKNDMKKETIVQANLAVLLITCSLVGCQTNNISELQRFETSIRKELPFRMDSLSWFDGGDIATYQFANQDYSPALPDAEIGMNGDVSVYRTFDFQEAIPANAPTRSLSRQPEDKVWRNVVVSKKNQRIICIDRYLKDGRTHGYVYVLQSESKKYPTLGKYHWDVSDPHNIEYAGGTLEHLRTLTLKRINRKGSYAAPGSQDDYWTLMFHADSLLEDNLCAEAKQMYDLAFTDDRYILPSQLSKVAYKMKAVGNNQAALEYFNHRLQMEKDFYMEPENCPYPELKDTFELRKQTWNYNLPLKEKLEWIFERDQYDRTLWSLTANRHPEQKRRNEMLRGRAWDTDSTNLLMVNEVLRQGGFPRKSQVGEFALLSIWSVFQHNPLEQQKEFLPQLEEAVRNGDIAPMYLAMLKDRIDVREGRPQKYGTQRGPDGLCPLQDASRVNEWRKEVGLPPIEIQ